MRKYNIELHKYSIQERRKSQAMRDISNSKSLLARNCLDHKVPVKTNINLSKKSYFGERSEEKIMKERFN